MEGTRSGVSSIRPEFILNPHQPVVLGDPFAPAGRTGLDLARSCCDREIGDEIIGGLAGPVAHNDPISAPTG